METVQLQSAVPERLKDILSDEALAFVVGLERTFGARRRELLSKRVERQARLDAGERPDFLPETKHIRESDWTVAALPVRSARPSRRDHRPCRSQDGHQRPELGRARLHGRLRRLHHADVAQRARRPGEPARRRAPHHHLRRSRQRQALRARREACGPLYPPARLAPGRSPHIGRRPADERIALRLWAVRLP